jgi:uncharacterized protein YutE (UPF0331/DUF86 family)
MADPGVVATKLRQIEQYHGELTEKRRLSEERFRSDVTERRAVERMFEIEFDGDRSKRAVWVLAEHDVITEETAATLADAVGFRNILAHEYGSVDPDRVYEYLQEELDGMTFVTADRDLADIADERRLNALVPS